MSLPVVDIFVLGGTITMAPGADGGITPTLTGDDLIAQVPGLENVAQLSVHTPFLKPGASLSMAEIAQVTSQIANEAQAAGWVVVQGTDTIDETSFLLSLLHRSDAPVVVTGAMRGAAALSADGPANLMAAISTAAHPGSRGRGALVVLNDEIHDAVFVEKMHKGLVSSFQSPNGGPLGYFLEGEPRYVRSASRYSLPRLAAPARFGKVAMVKLGLDDSDDILRALPDLGYDGVIVEAMGVGHVPSGMVPALAELAGRMPVVLASRVVGGPVFRNTYSFPGSEIDLLRRGLIPAGWLSPHKGRLLLAWAMGAGLDLQGVREAFSAFDF